MSQIPLKNYGLNLTGRGLGISTLQTIQSNYAAPYELDFKDVYSIGSSFADEVVVPLARLNGTDHIKIINANSIIKKCLRDVADEFKIVLEF